MIEGWEGDGSGIEAEIGLRRMRSGRFEVV